MTEPQRPAAPAWAWIAACLLMAMAALALQALKPVPALWLDWQPALARHEPWRWWSAALLHWSWGHLGTNLIALMVLGALGQQMRLPLAAVLAWVAAWPLTHLALLAQPQMLHYAGLSGLLHAGVAVAATWAVATLQPEGRRVGWLILAALCAKLLWETPWRTPSLPAAQGWVVAPWAHASGALLGVICACLALARGRPGAPPV